MKNFFSNKATQLAFIFIIIIGAFVGGTYIGYGFKPESSKVTFLKNMSANVASSTTLDAEKVDFESFWKAWNIINEKYVGESKKDTQKKVWGAIEGLAKSLGDPYTVFMPPEETKNFDAEIQGNFQGVGMEIGLRDGIITVIAPIKGSPADQAGIRSGDKILKIDKRTTTDMTVDQAVKLIRGEKGTVVVLNMFREGKKGAFDLSITRDVINLPTIDQNMRSDGIFVIKMYSFNAQSDQLFRQALQKFIDSGSDKLIVDLRGNPGGYLDVAIDLASIFLPKGDIVVRERFSEDKEELKKSFGYNVFTDKLKMIILVNEGSASASEIFAGALKEHGKAKLVGVKTFGKGSVQEVVKITPDTNLKVTIARWLTPNGVSISEKGIIPDYEVKTSADDLEKGRDPQLDKAVELLLK